MGLFTPDVVPEYKGSKKLKESIYAATNLTDVERDNITDLFQDLLNSGADPSRVALDAEVLGKEYPNLRPFKTGGRIYNQLLEERYKPMTGTEAINTANRNYLSVLGRTMTGEEQDYVAKERPSQQQLAEMLYANPNSNFAKAVTPTEEATEAYYGRLMPVKDPSTGAVGFTGARYGLKLNPVTYTG